MRQAARRSPRTGLPLLWAGSHADRLGKEYGLLTDEADVPHQCAPGERFPRSNRNSPPQGEAV